MAAAICLTACDDKNDSDYTPGTPTADDCMQVYFDNSNASDFITEPGVGSSIDVYVSRVDTTEAAEVPIVCKSAASELSVPSSVKFDAGQKTATLTIGYGDLKEPTASSRHALRRARPRASSSRSPSREPIAPSATSTSR